MGIKKKVLTKEEVLTEFLCIGIKKKWFKISTIGKLKDSCCSTLKIKVIDFDKTEEIHRKKIKSTSLKSCDALKFVIRKGKSRIDFIEMKSIRNVKPEIIKNEELLKQQIEKFEFIDKISESLHILITISNLNEIKLSKKERRIIRETPKLPILLTDIDEKDGLAILNLTLDFLSNTATKINELLKSEISKLGTDTINNLLEAKLMSCEQIEKFYSK